MRRTVNPYRMNGPKIDNPPVMGPAGRVHCTIQDWSKYVADFLRGMTGKPALLPAAAYEKLSTPPFGGDYALGWIVTERDWAGGTVLHAQRLQHDELRYRVDRPAAGFRDPRLHQSGRRRRSSGM